MRFTFFSFALLVLLGTTLQAQTDFEPYFIYQKGSKIKIGHFNKRQIPQGYTVYTVIDVTKTDSIDYLKLQVESLNKYQKALNSEIFWAEYHEGEIKIEKLFMLPVDTLAIIDEENYDIEGRDYILPAFLGNGIALSSAWVELSSNDSIAFKVSEYSRVVDNFEKIKTEIGDFDVCVISSKLETQYDVPELFTVYTYFSKGIGPVRTYYYNTKRKLVKYSEIVEMDIPGKL
ncbi:MAG TPA: hypothetical protein PLL66_06955 [Bacteroidales bacterium]|nr:hypothetical protein [Bacteroidales bacterium]